MKNLRQLATFSLISSSLILTASCSSGSGGASDADINANVPIGLVIDTNGDLIPDTDSRAVKKMKFAEDFYHGVVLHNCDDDDMDGELDDLDTEINGEGDLADLYPIKIRASELDADDLVVIDVSTLAKDKIRLFHQQSDQTFTQISLDHPVEIPASVLQAAPMIYVEATDFADKSWNGKFSFSVYPKNTMDDSTLTKPSIELRVAPWLMLSNASESEVLYIREHEGRNDHMIEQLRTILPQTGTELRVIPASADYPSWNIWIQDMMEIGRQFTPHGSMPVVLQANRNKGIDAFSKAELLGPDFGWFQVGDFRPDYATGDADYQWMDWFGNLEISPPLPNLPHGRMYYGEAGPGHQMDPRIVSKIEAQKLQKPFSVDVSYLIIKHADETVSWVPGKDGRWYCLVPSPAEMVELAKKIQRQGHGDLPMLEPFEENYTINKFLADGDGIARNMEIENGPLAKNIATLKRELGISDDQFIKVPAFIKPSGASLIPNMVNSAMVNGTFLVPDPAGPTVDGVDLIEADFRERLSVSDVRIEFIDDQQYHRWLGNVHCATNVLRTGEEHKKALVE